LGTGLTVLGVIRCLGRKGIPLFCLSEGLGFESHSRWCQRTNQAIGAFGTAAELANLLESSAIDRAVVIPCSDHWTREVVRLDPSLRQRFHLCLPDEATLNRFLDKRAFAELLDEVDVSRPTSRIVEGESDLAGVDIESGSTWFFKPTNSQRFLSHFGRKAFRLSTIGEAHERLAEIRRAGLEVILQEYIPGPADSHYFIDGFVDRGGQVQAFFARRRMRMYPPDFGNSSYVVSVETDRVSQAIETLKCLFEATHYRGVFSAEFKFDRRDERYKIIEVNCRPWWYVEFAAVCGVNVVEMAYRDALELPVRPVERYKIGVGLVFPSYDYHAFLHLRKTMGLGVGPWLRSWVGSKRAVFCWDDPMPALASFGERVTNHFKRK
jgi:predicted ATP-grasp superfamily ATP-dependent carboligase